MVVDIDLPSNSLLLHTSDQCDHTSSINNYQDEYNDSHNIENDNDNDNDNDYHYEQHNITTTV